MAVKTLDFECHFLLMSSYLLSGQEICFHTSFLCSFPTHVFYVLFLFCIKLTYLMLEISLTEHQEVVKDSV